jgi:hypothetical protein
MFCVLPSLNVPTAVYARLDAGASTSVAGLTAMETSVTELTFNGADPVTALNVALIFAVPGATAVTTLPLPTVATVTLSDAQVTAEVMICVLESLNVPVAVNVKLVAGAMVLPVGVTEIATSTALVTVSVTEALTVPTVAVMVVIPGVRPLASPQVLPTVATAVLDEVHVA